MSFNTHTNVEEVGVGDRCFGLGRGGEREKTRGGEKSRQQEQRECVCVCVKKSTTCI